MVISCFQVFKLNLSKSSEKMRVSAAATTATAVRTSVKVYIKYYK